MAVSKFIRAQDILKEKGFKAPPFDTAAFQNAVVEFFRENDMSAKLTIKTMRFLDYKNAPKNPPFHIHSSCCHTLRYQRRRAGGRRGQLGWNDKILYRKHRTYRKRWENCQPQLHKRRRFGLRTPKKVGRIQISVSSILTWRCRRLRFHRLSIYHHRRAIRHQRHRSSQDARLHCLAQTEFMVWTL